MPRSLRAGSPFSLRLTDAERRVLEDAAERRYPGRAPGRRLGPFILGAALDAARKLDVRGTREE